MGVEQTSQLIQLILNSVLMVTACVVLLGALLMRQTAIQNQLRSMNQEYFQLLSNAVMYRGDRLLQLKHQLQQSKQHYQTTHKSVFSSYCALIVLVASTLVLSLRTALNWEWLIPLSLGLFTVGVAMVLVSVSFAAWDFYLSKQSIWQELNWILGLGDHTSSDLKPTVAANRLLPAPRPNRRTRRTELTSQRRVGLG